MRHWTQEEWRNHMSAVADMRRQGLARFRSFGMPEWAREIAKEVSDRHRVCVSELASPARFRRIVKARNELIYLVKARKPMLSCPQLGRWFNRNHTSILHSLASHQERHELPKLVGYDIAKVRMRNAEISARMREDTLRKAR